MSENGNKICEISAKVYFKVYRQSELCLTGLEL